MSLISEALKKAEDKRRGMEERISVPLPPRPSGRKNKTLWYSLAVFLVLLIVIPLVVTFFVKKGEGTTRRVLQKETRTVTQRKEPVVQSTETGQESVNKVNTIQPSQQKPVRQGKPSFVPVPVTEQALQMGRQKASRPIFHPERGEKKSGFTPPSEASSVSVQGKEEIKPEEKPRLVIKIEEKTAKDCNAIMDEGKYSEAEKCFREQLKKGETRELLSSFGICELKLKKWQEAERAFEKAIKMNSTSSLLWFNYGISLFRQNKIDRAEKAFSLALRMDPPICEAHYYLGLCKDMKGQVQEALLDYKLSLACDLPSEIRSWVVQRIALIIKGSSR